MSLNRVFFLHLHRVPEKGQISALSFPLTQDGALFPYPQTWAKVINLQPAQITEPVPGPTHSQDICTRQRIIASTRGCIDRRLVYIALILRINARM
jgi:hypothetical protein